MAFNSVTKTFSNEKDSVAIRNYVGGIAGGVFLSTSGLPASQKTIPALTVVTRNTTTGICAPLVIEDGAYKQVAAPTGTEIIGLTIATVPTDEPAVGVINAGEVNETCLPFLGTTVTLATLKAALKTALPALILTKDY